MVQFNNWKTKCLGFAAAVAIATGAYLTAPSRIYAETPVQTGTRYFDQGEYQKAFAAYEKAIKQNPKEAEAYFGLARIRFMAEQDDLALSDANRAIELYPDFAAGYELRAWIKHTLKDYDGAIADIDTAIALQPNDSTLYISRGEIYREQGDNSQGFEDLSKGMKDPRANEKINEISRYERTLLYGNKEDNTKAIARYTEILAINPDANQTRRKRASVYAEQEKYEAAIMDYTKLIELNPNEPDYYEQRAWCFYNLGRNEEEDADIQKARKIRTER